MMRKTIVIFLLIAFSSFGLFAQNKVDELLSNTKVYSKSDSSIFPNPNNQYRFFIMGEYHFKDDNSELFLNAFKNLYKNENVRIVFMESGYANTIILNHYLETGDESSLSYVLENFQFKRYVYEDLLSFYDTLPENEKFKFVGVDLEIYEADTKFQYATQLLTTDNEIPDSLNNLINEFEDHNYADDTEAAQKSFDKICFDWKRNNEKYKELMGDNYKTYVTLIKKIKKSYRFDYYNYNYGKDSIKQTNRERYIYNMIVSEVNKNPDCNFFGQFGLAHIGLERFLIVSEADGFQSFSAKLNSNKKSPLRDQVCSIAILYFDYEDEFSNKLVLQYQNFRYFMSRKQYLPKKIYKTLKENTIDDKMYVVNVSECSSNSCKKASKNFQFLIFNR